MPHPVYSEENQSKFAIIVRDPQRQYKDKIQNMNIPLIAKVKILKKKKKSLKRSLDTVNLIKSIQPMRINENFVTVMICFSVITKFTIY